jgi:hypothetical protein
VVPDDRLDAVAGVGQADELVVEPDAARVQLFRPGTQQGLQPDLRQVGGPVGAGLHVHRVRVARPPRLDGADHPAVLRARPGEAGVPGGPAHVLRRRAARVDRVGDTDLAEDLHAALVEHMGLGQDRRLRVPADEQGIDSEGRQQHRSGEASPAAADDQDVGLQVGHDVLLRTAGSDDILSYEYVVSQEVLRISSVLTVT